MHRRNIAQSLVMGHESDSNASWRLLSLVNILMAPYHDAFQKYWDHGRIDSCPNRVQLGDNSRRAVSTSEDTDERILPPDCAIPPERVEMIDIAASTQVRRVDTVRCHTGSEQLPAVGVGQVD